MFNEIFDNNLAGTKTFNKILEKASTEYTIIPENIGSFSKVQLRKYTKNLTDLYIVNKHLYSIFFQASK